MKRIFIFYDSTRYATNHALHVKSVGGEQNANGGVLGIPATKNSSE
jgi:hypothetical protein